MRFGFALPCLVLSYTRRKLGGRSALGGGPSLHLDLASAGAASNLLHTSPGLRLSARKQADDIAGLASLRMEFLGGTDVVGVATLSLS
jgi:hypothetical protein